jgi:hypothetical protein
MLSLWLSRLPTDRIARLREFELSFQGASAAIEPGIQKQTRCVYLDSGSPLTRRPE